ncbi:MAG: hypothetical protein AB8F95_09560, partial [Bacteroidia bacterium]
CSMGGFSDLFDYFNIIFACIVIFYLIKDYKTDGKRHRTAKILHAICMFILVIIYSDSISQLVRLVSNFENIGVINPPVGLITSNVMRGVYMINVFLGIIALFIFSGMLARNEKRRRMALVLFLILGGIGSISTYIQFTVMSSKMELSASQSGFIITSAIVLHLCIFLALFFLYRSKMMVRFFARDGVTGKVTEKELDEKIESLGSE